MKSLRIRLARWILGRHCPCYQMGYHVMVDCQQRSKDAIDRQKARAE